jgi:hypothetical protein
MRIFTVQYRQGDYDDVFTVTFEAMTLHQAAERALSILFLNDCPPQNHWRILDVDGNVISYDNFSLDPFSSARIYYNVSGKWDHVPQSTQEDTES